MASSMKNIKYPILFMANKSKFPNLLQILIEIPFKTQEIYCNLDSWLIIFKTSSCFSLVKCFLPNERISKPNLKWGNDQIKKKVAYAVISQLNVASIQCCGAFIFAYNGSKLFKRCHYFNCKLFILIKRKEVILKIYY